MEGGRKQAPIRKGYSETWKQTQSAYHKHHGRAQLKTELFNHRLITDGKQERETQVSTLKKTKQGLSQGRANANHNGKPDFKV